MHIFQNAISTPIAITLSQGEGTITLSTTFPQSRPDLKFHPSPTPPAIKLGALTSTEEADRVVSTHAVRGLVLGAADEAVPGAGGVEHVARVEGGRLREHLALPASEATLRADYVVHVFADRREKLVDTGREIYNYMEDLKYLGMD